MDPLLVRSTPQRGVPKADLKLECWFGPFLESVLFITHALGLKVFAL